MLKVVGRGSWGELWEKSRSGAWTVAPQWLAALTRAWLAVRGQVDATS